MPTSWPKTYHEVSQDDNSSEQGLLTSAPKPRTNNNLLPAILTLIILLSSTLNIHLLRSNHTLTTHHSHLPDYTPISTLPLQPKTYHTYTAYSSINTSISDPLWSAFTTNGFVALDQKFTTTHNLAAAQPFPDDPSKGIYVLDAFHNLHCIMYLRDAIADLRRGTSVDDRLVHINHCYDALRQSVQCRADDTPLTTPYHSKLTGEGQVRMCRDWDALTRWAEERSACWPTGRCADLESRRS